MTYYKVNNARCQQFDAEIARKYGIYVAIILEHLQHREFLDSLHKEKFNPRSASLQTLCLLFDYFTEDQIKESLECIKNNHLFNI
jgi:hypothetical protein